MIIALYGQRSSGKTTLANTLRQHLEDCPIRHCGEVVKARAQNLHLSPNDLPEEEHRRIDGETRAWSETEVGLKIVEGRYLQYVLSRTRGDVRLIEVVCDESDREQRWAKQVGHALGPEGISFMDAEDWGFAAKIYSELSPRAPGMTVDTSLTDVNKCVRQILDWLSQSSLR